MNQIVKIFSWNGNQSSHRLMILIVFALGLFNFIWGEKVPAGEGLGWDGVYYAEMVHHLDSMISGGQLSHYYTQRILPSFIVRSLLLLSGMSLDSDVNIIRGFELYNLSLLILACYVWQSIANHFTLSLSGRWIGFSGIFINFECSKQAFYYPVLCDVTALFVAMLLLLFYVKKRPFALLIVTILGSFSWPVVSICGAFLLLFLKTKLPKHIITPKPSLLSYNILLLIKKYLIEILAITTICYLLLFQITDQACTLFEAKLEAFAHTVQSISDTIDRVLSKNNVCIIKKLMTKVEQILTALPSIIGLTIMITMLISFTEFFRFILVNLRKVQPSLIALATAAIFIPALIVKLISNPNVPNASSLLLLIKCILFPAEGKILLPIITLSVFWGPIVLMLLLYWRSFCIQARNLGPGVVLVITTSLCLGLVGEPRFLTLGWPFIVLGLVLAMESSTKKPNFKYAFIFLTILYGQFWIRLNYAPWPGSDGEYLQNFPKQLYFMHYGLWMSWLTYILQSIFLILSALWLRSTVIKIK